MNSLKAFGRQALVRTEVAALRTWFAFREPKYETLSSAYETLAGLKSQKGKHAKALELLDKAKKYSKSAGHLAGLEEKEANEFSSLAKFHNALAARLRKEYGISFQSKQEKREGPQSRTGAYITQERKTVLDINAMDEGLVDTHKLLLAARSLLIASIFHSKASELFEKTGKRVLSVSEIKSAADNCNLADIICSNSLQLPTDHVIVENNWAAPEGIQVSDILQMHSRFLDRYRKLTAVQNTP